MTDSCIRRPSPSSRRRAAAPPGALPLARRHSGERSNLLTDSPRTPVTRRGLPARRPRRSPSATRYRVAAEQVMNEAAASVGGSFLGVRVLVSHGLG
jgi:hypothetical protein